MDSPSLELRQAGAVLTVALNRPENHNALNAQLIDELTSTFRDINHQKSFRIIILTGNGRSFCAGADLSTTKIVASHGFDRNLVDGQAIFDLMVAINECPLPVICRVNGSALGGGLGLVSCCDIVVAVESANFGFSEVRLGLLPAVISPFVVSKIGVSRARELFLTGERFKAGFAKEVGLVQHVVAEEDLDHAVEERTNQLLLAAPGAQAEAKKLIRAVQDKPTNQLRGITTDIFARRWNSAEGKEGLRAFIEKRKPDWQN